MYADGEFMEENIFQMKIERFPLSAGIKRDKEGELSEGSVLIFGK